MGQKLLVFGYVSSLLLVFIGVVSVTLSDKLIHSFISSQYVLLPPSQLFQQWMSPPIDVYLTFYLFDLKNGNDFEKNGSKPVFEEIGPFVFKEVITKEDIIDNFNNTITYKERRSYTFMPDMSPYNESYPITQVNMAPVTVINQIRYMSGPVHTIANLALSLAGETLLTTQTVRDLLFGYEDKFLKEVIRIEKIFGLNLVPSDIVGLFIGKNDTIDGQYVAYTGQDNYTKVGLIERFNTMDTLNFWSDKYANMINGTDGTLNAPFISNYFLDDSLQIKIQNFLIKLHILKAENDVLYIFESDLCRSLYANYNGSATLLDNIDVLKFSPGEYFFANHTVNPDNAGFCTPAGNCLKAGLLNLTNCLGGVPLVMSCPHYLFAPQEIVDDVVGIKPNLTQHQTLIYIEPLTGIPMKAHKRLQFNTQLFKDARISLTANIPDVLYPLFWLDENFELNQKIADQFYYSIKLPLEIVKVMKFVVLGVGCVLLVICMAISYRSWKRNQPSDENYDENSLIVNSEIR